MLPAVTLLLLSDLLLWNQTPEFKRHVELKVETYSDPAVTSWNQYWYESILARDILFCTVCSPVSKQH